MRSALVNKVHFTKYLNGGTDWDAGYLKGTLYVPPFMVESSVLAQITNKFTRYIKAIPYLPKTFDTAISNGSSLDTELLIILLTIFLQILPLGQISIILN